MLITPDRGSLFGIHFCNQEISGFVDESLCAAVGLKGDGAAANYPSGIAQDIEMEIVCSSCKARYVLKDEILSSGQSFRLACKACKSPIVIDGQPRQANAVAPDKESPADLKKKILKSIKDLPLVPQVVLEIQNQLSQPNVNMQKVARMVETDPGIASKVLRIANSAYYGASGKTSTIMQACVLMGIKGLSEVVVLAGTEKALSGKLPGYGYDAGELWKHSLAVAFGSKILAQRREPGLSSAAHTAGLIHDIGKIILDPYVKERKQPIENYMETNQKTFLDAEIEFFGFSHAEVAAAVCSAWKFPELITKAIQWQNNPAGSNGDLLAYILHMADHLALMGGAGYDEDDILSEVQKETMSVLDLKQADLSEIAFKLLESVNQIGTA
jgi:putative nucleotidyltransferase with HDIG domain